MDQSFFLGLAGTILSVISLTVQVVTWKASGPRLTVSFQAGIPVGVPGQPKILTGIQVTNRGRAETIISGVRVRLPGGKTIPLVEDYLEQVTFPRAIPPGDMFCAYYDPNSLEYIFAKYQIPESVRVQPEAVCGHGDVQGKRMPVSTFLERSL